METGCLRKDAAGKEAQPLPQGAFSKLLQKQTIPDIALPGNGGLGDERKEPKAKAKAKTGKKKSNPKAVWELKKFKHSDLKMAIPVVDRTETRKSLEKEVLAKA